MSQSYYRSTIESFLRVNDDEIVGKLNKAGTSFASQWTIATTSWDSSIQILKKSFLELIDLNPLARKWHILLEYEIPRILSRIDAVIIAEDIIFIVEFKYQRAKYEAEDIRQVEKYANELHDFHLESKNKILVPILLAPKAKGVLREPKLKFGSLIPSCIKTNESNFSKIVYDVYVDFHNSKNPLIDAHKWEESEYQPTPAIIQAAKALFADQKVETISKSGAAQSDLDNTTNYLIEAINKAKSQNKKIVCFVTGVPGAGKTLVGLNLIHSKKKFGGETTNTAYFSGNAPLINVLKEALYRDHFYRQKKLFEQGKITAKPKKKDSENEVKSKIQNLHSFIKNCIVTNTPPTEKIVVFDEAQRCWNAVHFKNKSTQNQNRERNPFIIEEKSEAELLFEFMDRHQDWSVIIALVGGGQEINTGEGGISEWGKALRNKYSDWEVHISNELLVGDSSTSGMTLFDSIPLNLVIHKNPNLHLSVSQRSFRANNLNAWVNALIDNRPEEALRLSNSIKDDYPLFITRNIATAKEWLKQKRSAEKRYGLVASSGAHRLKSYGVFVKHEIDEAMWFLNDVNDVRSSYFLEMVATEYKVQGLELDWVGICWDADLRRFDDKWMFKNFEGSSWNKSDTTTDQQFILNTYRVLLTRAREGIIIFVPQGDSNDKTALPEFYGPIFNYLISCGLTEIS